MRNTPKGLNEELMKMRKLMDFDISENSHDVLSESNVEKSILSEEHGGNFNKKEKFKTDIELIGQDVSYFKDNCISPKETAFKLQNKLNDLLETMLGNVEKQIKIKLGDKGVSISGSEYIPWKNRVRFTLPTPIKLSTTLNTLFSDEEMGECFKILYNNFPVISNQLNNDTFVLSFNDILYKKFNVKKNYCKDKLVSYDDLTLNTLNNPFCIKASKKHYINIESEGNVILKKIQLSGAELLPDSWTPPPTPKNKCECEDVKTGEMIKYPCGGTLPPECIKPIIAPEPLVVNTKQNYDFDNPGITQLAKDEIDKQIFAKLIAEPKERLQQYVDFLKGKEIIVRAYSSRDRNPKDLQNGKYVDCQKSNSTIADYNKCLSQKRAENVVEYLKTSADGLLKDINFKAIGMGENCQSGFCWPSKQHSTSKTQIDRRFSVQFPMWGGKVN